mmetsp:Transcript_28719/g.73034  ORF Transcript_28719/g.73034 Transcript_28719/m.73034 type:complete len:322 (-) Transcript_28719:1084-2049(-)
MNVRKEEEMRLRRPSSMRGSRPLLSRSASRSISSTISRVRLQSNSLTVHLTCSSTSSRSSMVSSGRLSPLYSAMSSLARVVKGVCTSTCAPFFSSYFLGLDISPSVRCTRRSLFSWLALILSRSIVCSSLVSLCSSCCSTSPSLSLGRPAALILRVSCSRHASSSLYRISKSAAVRGCMRRSISRRRCSSAAACALSSSSRRNASRSAFFARRYAARLRPSHPRTQRWMVRVAAVTIASRSSLVWYLPGVRTTSYVVSIVTPGRSICVPASRVVCALRVFVFTVCVVRSSLGCALAYLGALGVCVNAWWYTAPVRLLRYPP